MRIVDRNRRQAGRLTTGLQVGVSRRRSCASYIGRPSARGLEMIRSRVAGSHRADARRRVELRARVLDLSVEDEEGDPASPDLTAFADELDARYGEDNWPFTGDPLLF